MSSDIAELKALVASMAKEAAARDKKAEERVAEMQAENAKLIAALSGAGNQQPPG